MKHKNLLLTGFEPWDEHRSNPSKDFLETAPVFSGWAVSYCLLPVSDACFALFKKKVIEAQPDFIISLGLAADRNEISIETRATRGSLVPAGPERLFSSCALEDVVQSSDAGTFYCNDIFYLGLKAARARQINAAFIHLPPNVDQTSVYTVVHRLLNKFG